jgi:hypothetical protein
MNVSPMQIIIGFKDTLAIQEIQSIIDKYTFIKTFNQFHEFYKSLVIADLKEGISCEEFQNDLNTLKNDTNILFANPSVFGNDGSFCGVLDEFIVCLKDSTQLSELELQNIALQTNTTIVRKENFLPLFYLLSATKFSKGDAFEMSDYFYETGKFASAEPNLLIENGFN